MEGGSENSKDSDLMKKVQTNDGKEEVAIAMDDKAKIIDIEKVRGEGKIEEDERKKDEEKKGNNNIDMGVEIEEVKKGDDVKEINEMKNDEAKEEDVKAINEMKNNYIKAKKGYDVREVYEMKDDEAKGGDAEVINEMKKDEAKEKVTKEIKNDEVNKEDVTANEVLKVDGTKKENEGEINEKKTSEAIKKEDEKNAEVGFGVAKKKYEKGDESKEKQDDNQSGEKNISDDVKGKVVTIDENPKFVDVEGEGVSSCNVVVSRLSFKEESNLFSDLKENEKKALVELRSKVEEAITENQLFKANENDNIKEKNKGISSENGDKEMEKSKETDGKEDSDDDQGNKASSSVDEPAKEKGKKEQESEEKSIKSEKENMVEEKDIMTRGNEGKADIKLWGVPLLPSNGGNATDSVLLKFLRARDFKIIEAFEMLRNTIQWRKENNMDSILDEDLGNDFNTTAYISGNDRQGHPVCYNIFGVLSDDEMYNKTLGTEENRDKFLRWRLRLMEEGIEKLDFIGVSSMMQINDLKNTPGPSKKEARLFMKQVVSLLQDNYPEFVVKNIFINVPFWYYAFAAVLSPFLTQRTKSKFVYARPSKVTETLLKYIDVGEIPVCYGGLKRDNDSDFSAEDHVEEILVKQSSTETIEIPTPKAGSVIMWDLVVLGWEVSYKEEFIPNDEKSYTIVVQKEKKLGIQEGSIRNSFKNNEPGKIILVIGNSAFKTKKRAFYRYKIKNIDSSNLQS
ncbi:hypothetical protein PTKIN_Ptkin19aG0008400 [Pterospermum kingtungense]